MSIAIALLILPLPSAASGVPTVEPALVIKATTTAAAMPDRRYVFGRSGDRAFVWDAMTGRLIADVPGWGGAIDPKSGNAILGPELWNLPRAERILDLSVRDDAVIASGFSPDGRKALVASVSYRQGIIDVWDVDQRKRTGRITRKLDRLEFLALSPDAEFLAVGSGKTFDVVEVRSGRVAKTGSLSAVWPFRKKPNGFAEFVDGRSRDFDLIFKGAWAGRGRRPLWLIDWQQMDRADVFAGSDSIAGREVKIKGREARIGYAVEGENSGVLKHDVDVTSYAFSPDRWSIATGDRKGNVKIWDVKSGRQIYAIRPLMAAIHSLSYSPDAQFLLAASRSELRVYPAKP